MPVSQYVKNNGESTQNLIFRGPVFSTSINEFRFLLKNNFNNFPNVFSDSQPSKEVRNDLINSYKLIDNNKIDNLEFNGKAYIFVGGGEIISRLDDINSFLSNNPNFILKTFEEASHLIYEPFLPKDDDKYFFVKNKLIEEQFSTILKILSNDQKNN